MSSFQLQSYHYYDPMLANRVAVRVLEHLGAVGVIVMDAAENPEMAVIQGVAFMAVAYLAIVLD